MFDQLRQRFFTEAAKNKSVQVEALRPSQVGELNLNWTSHFNTPALREHIEEFPGLTLRVSGHSDYIVGDNWRRRAEIGQITETRSRYQRTLLVDELLGEFARRNYKLVILGHDEHTDHQEFYADAGFEELERIVYYERLNMRIGPLPQSPPVAMEVYRHSPAQIRDLLEADNAAFPWLWWNSRAELDYYQAQEGVHIYLAYQNQPQGQGGKRPVGYFGFTLYDRWAHLDRLAVVPGLQGQRVGAYQLGYAINLMERLGAQRVTLSTQLNNTKSQALYEGFNFRRVKSLEYNLVGRWLHLSSAD
jgi:ribosomal protein S18 acetylase RimI-like enzyme